MYGLVPGTMAVAMSGTSPTEPARTQPSSSDLCLGGPDGLEHDLGIGDSVARPRPAPAPSSRTESSTATVVRGVASTIRATGVAAAEESCAGAAEIQPNAMGAARASAFTTVMDASR